jgi:gliding motility-associated-like protein
VVNISDTCKGVPIQNKLYWNNGNEFYCIDDVLSYKVYFSETENTGSYNMIFSTLDSSFVHKDLISYDGCYYITAINKYNIESPKSNTVCNRTCIDQFVCGDLFISNLITSNGDNNNETFLIKGAYSKLEVEIYNRWGDQVLHSLVYKNDFTGEDLEAGIYYFSVTAGNGKYCNGWLHIIK